MADVHERCVLLGPESWSDGSDDVHISDEDGTILHEVNPRLSKVLRQVILGLEDKLKAAEAENTRLRDDYEFGSLERRIRNVLRVEKEQDDARKQSR